MTQIVPSTSFFNGTNRTFVAFSTLLTVAVALLICLIGPQRLSIPSIHFSLCDSTETTCTNHITIYSAAFGSMVMFFASAIVLTIFRSSQYTLDQSITFRIAQIITQIALSVGITYAGEIVYKIGYWMFFNSLKYFFLQSKALLTSTRQFHHYCVRTGRNNSLLLMIIGQVMTYFFLAGVNGYFFFGAQCNNHYDILYVCVVTANILGALASIFDSVHGLFLPLFIATVSQFLLCVTLHLSPAALQCSDTPFKGIASQWVFFVIMLVSYAPITINLFFSWSSPLNQYLSIHSKLLVNIGHNVILFPTHDNPNHNNNNLNSNNINSSSSYNDPLLLINDWSIQSSLSEQKNYSISDIDPTSTENILYENSQDFIKEYYYSSRTLFTPAVHLYILAIFVLSIITFALTHFGEHKHYSGIGMISGHIQWFYVMYSSWLYFIYTWYLLARNLFPDYNLI